MSETPAAKKTRARRSSPLHLPRAIAIIFGVGTVEAFRMAALNVVEEQIRKASTEDLKLLSTWLGSVFATAEHERRRRDA